MGRWAGTILVGSLFGHPSKKKKEPDTPDIVHWISPTTNILPQLVQGSGRNSSKSKSVLLGEHDLIQALLFWNAISLNYLTTWELWSVKKTHRLFSSGHLGKDLLQRLGNWEEVQAKGKKRGEGAKSRGQEETPRPLGNVVRGEQDSVTNMFASFHSQLLRSSVSHTQNKDNNACVLELLREWQDRELSKIFHWSREQVKGGG